MFPRNLISLKLYNRKQLTIKVTMEKRKKEKKKVWANFPALLNLSGEIRYQAWSSKFLEVHP